MRRSPAGQLVPTSADGTNWWAFVPNPLPPRLDFDVELVSVLAEANGAIGELRGVGRRLPNPDLLIGPFIRKEAVLSSRIEGTQAGLKDIYALEAGQLMFPGMTASSPKSDVQEVAAYVRALNYGIERMKSLPVSLRLVRELHEILMQGAKGDQARRGEFRTDQNWIGAPGSKITEASFVPPPPEGARSALALWEQYLHSDDALPPLVRLAVTHYQFEAIHPFGDGNGRIGRLLISLLLVSWGLLPLPLLYLSAYFERHRDSYLDLLLEVSEQGTWRQWILFFLRGVVHQADDAVRRVESLQDLQQAWRERLTQMRGTARLLRLADSLFDSPILTIPAAAKVMGVTYPAAQASVAKLVEANILQQVKGMDYGKIYVALDVFRTIDEAEPSSGE